MFQNVEINEWLILENRKKKQRTIRLRNNFGKKQ